MRRLPESIRKRIVNETYALEGEPLLGLPLKGKFRAFRSLHLKLSNVQYRVVYEINESKHEVCVHGVGARQNFYEQLETMKIRSLRAAKD